MKLTLLKTSQIRIGHLTIEENATHTKEKFFHYTVTMEVNLITMKSELNYRKNREKLERNYTLGSN